MNQYFIRKKAEYLIRLSCLRRTGEIAFTWALTPLIIDSYLIRYLFKGNQPRPGFPGSGPASISQPTPGAPTGPVNHQQQMSSQGATTVSSSQQPSTPAPAGADPASSTGEKFDNNMMSKLK